MLIRNIYQYLSFEPVDDRVFKMIRFLFHGIAAILLFWFLYFSILTVTMPYQIEYREGAARLMTQILLTGGNPFSWEYQPLAMNNYGIGYSLAVLPSAKLFGNTLLVHRGTSLFFLLACLLLVTNTLWRIKKDALPAIVGGLFIVVLLAGLGGLGAFPTTMAAFLFLLAVLIPFLYSFRYPSLIVSALLSIMAVYTKPYFVIGFGVVAAYTFAFVSKKKGIVYGLFFLSAFALLFLGVRYVFDLYFIDTFISNLSNASRSLAHLRIQLREMGAEFYPSILLAGTLLLSGLPKISPTSLLRMNLLSRSSFLQLDAPLIHVPVNYFAFTFVLCFLAFVLVLGLHNGSYMTSAYQIVLPPFILWLLQTLNAKNRSSIIAFGLLLGNILLLDSILLSPAFLHQSDSAGWRSLHNYVETSHRVLNSPAIVSALMDAGLVPSDSGQTEYYYSIKSYADNALIGPSYKEVKKHGAAYRRSIQNAVKNLEFDRIFVTEGYGNLISVDLIGQYYARVDTITLDMPQSGQTWVIGIWEPINGNR